MQAQAECKQCHVVKPITEFWITDKARGYRRGQCKECDKARQRAYYAAKPEYQVRVRAQSVAWAKANPRTKQKARQYAIKNMYGLLTEAYEAMLVAQDAKCALCFSEGPGRKHGKWADGHWNIDHCHETNRVRGLLCLKCNTRIGSYEVLLREIGLEKLTAYLRGPHDNLQTQTSAGLPGRNAQADPC